MSITIGKLDSFPSTVMSHTPTPIDEMPNLARYIGATNLYIKRDDCTGLGKGGNKSRQLEFYVGQAEAEGADTLVITGAVQSNFTRMAAAAACKNGMKCHVQLEERVPDPSPNYRRSGNVLLSRLLGATLHAFSEGENETGADLQLEHIAADLRAKGKRPYVIHLGQGHPPLGALGYVVAAMEINQQIKDGCMSFDEIVVASGSGATHAGLLFGLRALGNPMPVKGICVRRSAKQQQPRIANHCRGIADLLDMKNPVTDDDVDVNDDVFSPGYGKLNDAVEEAIKLTANKEGIILDPVYSGKAMAGFLNRARHAGNNQNLLFLHTGGQPAVFAYEAELEPLLSDNME
jgi:D-cysteine desulfhydrase/L-cysteate sulfo-lyase